jgi:hypothetical protein
MAFTKSLRNLAMAGAATAALGAGSVAYAAETIKVGVLHSLSGTMAISETTLKDAMLMLIRGPGVRFPQPAPYFHIKTRYCRRCQAAF